MLADHLREAATLERRALWAYAACALLIALLGLMTAAILARRIAQPIRSLAAAVEDFVSGGFRSSLHSASRDPRYKEVKELEANFAILQHELDGHIHRLNERVRERTEELLREKENVQVKNEQITQSLRYARGLQNAMLSTAGDLERALPGSFALSMPKDIVGGDFLWVREVEVNGTKRVLFAVADCTGHGVPASLLSVMCHNALNEALGALDEPLPCLLLERINELFSQFMVSGQDGGFGDGMTIALCSFDAEMRRLVFAGSFQSIYIVDATGVTRIEGDAVFIGSAGQDRKERHFRDHYLEVEDGSMIYLTSDGLQDQFGGEHGKKFMRNRLGQMLAEAHLLSSAEQQRFIRDRFKVWKGDQEQVDDVLLVGIRVDMEMTRLSRTGS
jgi:serine phosphatase RsbU (regulator of sigma subunit)